MNVNQSLSIVSNISKAAAPETIMASLESSIRAAAAKDSLSNRWIRIAVPFLHRVSRHKRATENQRVQVAEILSMVQAKATPSEIIARVFDVDAERLTSLPELPTEPVSPVDTISPPSEVILTAASEVETVPVDDLIKLFASAPAAEIVPASSGLFDEAKAIAIELRIPLHTDHVLMAMDRRFPYTKIIEATRDLVGLRDELAVYMELDSILVLSEDASDPLRIAAEHRIKLMKEVPNGPEPVWFRQIRW